MDQSPPCVKVQANAKYIPEQSSPEHKRYVFAYVITIKNLSSHTIQLLSRQWLITDGNGKQLTVEGDGVVGEQPIIPANDEYTYTSGTAIESPFGVMQGQYIMKITSEKQSQKPFINQSEEHNKSDQSFTAVIDPFRLYVPNVLN